MNVREEMGRVYRAARSGRISTEDAGRLAAILASMSRLIEGADLERRLEAVERRQHQEVTR
jgi:hypothetical protein